MKLSRLAAIAALFSAAALTGTAGAAPDPVRPVSGGQNPQELESDRKFPAEAGQQPNGTDRKKFPPASGKTSSSEHPSGKISGESV